MATDIYSGGIPKKELTYEEFQKLKWKNYKRKWNFMTDQERCDTVAEARHTTPSWIPKDFMWTMLDWFITEIEYERIEVYSVFEDRRDRFRLVKPEQRDTEVRS